MKHVQLTSVLAAVAASIAVGVAAAPSHAGPITKQNGAKPAFNAFTSICAVPGYADYGLCGGDATAFAQVKGKMNAIQAKQGRYNLDFTFTNLTPGVEYRLWATRNAVPFQRNVPRGRASGRRRLRQHRLQAADDRARRAGIRPEHGAGRRHDRDLVVVRSVPGRQPGRHL